MFIKIPESHSAAQSWVNSASKSIENCNTYFKEEKEEDNTGKEGPHALPKEDYVELNAG